MVLLYNTWFECNTIISPQTKIFHGSFTDNPPSCRMFIQSKKVKAIISLTWVCLSIIHEKDLAGAHNSLVDAKAQTDVVLHPYFKGYWDKKHSVRLIDDMWKKKTVRNANQKDEANWPVPESWQTGINVSTWAPSYDISYEGPSGGPDIYGPSSSIAELCRISECISEMFLYYFPLQYLII